MQQELIQLGYFVKMDMLMEQGNVSLIVELGNMAGLNSQLAAESQLIQAASPVIPHAMNVLVVAQGVVYLAKKAFIFREIQQLRLHHLKKHLVLVLLKQ